MGSGLEAARQELADAGFQVDVQESDRYIGLNYVLDQDPGGGDLAPTGSTITIYLV